MSGKITMKKETIYRVFTHIPELETERLLLRKMLPSDYADMYEYASRFDVTRYLLWNAHPNPEYSRQYLEYIKTRYRAGDFYDWAVTLKKEKKMIGTCGFTKFNFANNSAEIGYVLNPHYWHLGMASEAASAVIRFGFDVLRLHRIEACYMVDNLASRAVMERIGMTYEGTHRSSMKIKGKYESIGVCAIVADDYRKMFC